MLKSTKHEIYHANKNVNAENLNKDFFRFQTRICCIHYFKMPIIVGILTFTSIMNSMLSCIDNTDTYNGPSQVYCIKQGRNQDGIELSPSGYLCIQISIVMFTNAIRTNISLAPSYGKFETYS